MKKKKILKINNNYFKNANICLITYFFSFNSVKITYNEKQISNIKDFIAEKAKQIKNLHISGKRQIVNETTTND